MHANRNQNNSFFVQEFLLSMLWKCFFSCHKTALLSKKMNKELAKHRIKKSIKSVNKKICRLWSKKSQDWKRVVVIWVKRQLLKRFLQMKNWQTEWIPTIVSKLELLRSKVNGIVCVLVGCAEIQSNESQNITPSKSTVARFFATDTAMYTTPKVTSHCVFTKRNGKPSESRWEWRIKRKSSDLLKS